MVTVGIICEYNPFHNGHARQISKIRETFGPDCAIVCLMSGNFVQRGMPAIFDKMTRAKAALEYGADLVLELPVTAALSSAEGFAAGGVEILGKFCDKLCFGSESGSSDLLMQTARMLLSPTFPPLLREQLDKGFSFPAARQKALEAMGCSGDVLGTPNDILGVEYCKAILTSGTAMEPYVIQRIGDYHAENADRENPSATSLRRLLHEDVSIADYIPRSAEELFQGQPIHRLEAGERAILARLRTMTDEDFEVLPYGSEGLWRKLMHESRRQSSLEDILSAVKSKRYTRTRLDRMVMCAFLGIRSEDMATPAPFVRILGFSHVGQSIVRQARNKITLYNVGEKIDHPYAILERRVGDLYGLFAVSAPEGAGREDRYRIIPPKKLH